MKFGGFAACLRVATMIATTTLFRVLGISVAVGSLGWVLLADGSEAVAKGPVRSAPSHSAGVSAGEVDSGQQNAETVRKPARLKDVQACESSESCGDARACVDGQCVHCVADAECEAGMICVLSRCMVPDDGDFAADEDCENGGYCVGDVRAEGAPRGRWLS